VQGVSPSPPHPEDISVPVNRITRRLFAAGITTTLAVGAATVLPAALQYESAEAKYRKKRPLKISVGRGSGGSGGGQSTPLVSATAAAYSTSVALTNKTGCTLEFVSEHLDAGIWSDDGHPNRNGDPTKIKDGDRWTFASQSLFVYAGTEGTTEWRTTDCDKSALDGKTLKFHWENKPLQRNNHDFDGTDPALKGKLDDVAGNGWGNNAYAGITVTGA